MAYSGRYSVKNKEKYEGDPTKVIFRSLWERQVFKWVDENKNIVKWSSEEVVVPYRCQTDNRIHRYFIDVKLIMSNGSTYLVEIKPKSQCKPPKQPSRKSKNSFTLSGLLVTSECFKRLYISGIFISVIYSAKDFISLFIQWRN